MAEAKRQQKRVNTYSFDGNQHKTDTASAAGPEPSSKARLFLPVLGRLVARVPV